MYLQLQSTLDSLWNHIKTFIKLCKKNCVPWIKSSPVKIWIETYFNSMSKQFMIYGFFLILNSKISIVEWTICMRL